MRRRCGSSRSERRPDDDRRAFSLAAAAALIVGVCAGASPSQAFFGMGKSGEIIGRAACGSAIGSVRSVLDRFERLPV